MTVSFPRDHLDRARESSVSSLGSGRGQISRLLQLVLALQSDSYPNANDLATVCEVSRRTIYRDLEILASAGIVVRYRSDHQGYQLASHCSLPAPSLEEREALAYLVLARQSRGDGCLGLVNEAQSGALKIAQGLTPEARNRLICAAESLPDHPTTGQSDKDRKEIHDAILGGLTQRRQLRIWYLDSDGQTLESTKLSLYCLVQRHGLWCLIGRSTLHRGVRTIRVPWIQRAEMTPDASNIPPRFRLERYLGQAWIIDRGPVRHEVNLRFSARVAPTIRETVRHQGCRFVTLNSGRLDLRVVVDGLDEIAGWVLGFGDGVEVLSPPELRERLREEALRVARRHGHVG